MPPGFGFGAFAGSDAADQIEDALADIVNGFFAFDDGSGVDVHVVVHDFGDARIRRNLNHPPKPVV